MKMEEFGGLWFDPCEIRLVKVQQPSSLDAEKRWRVYLELHSATMHGAHGAWADAKYLTEQEARDAAVGLARMREAAAIALALPTNAKTERRT